MSRRQFGPLLDESDEEFSEHDPVRSTGLALSDVTLENDTQVNTLVISRLSTSNNTATSRTDEHSTSNTSVSEQSPSGSRHSWRKSLSRSYSLGAPVEPVANLERTDLEKPLSVPSVPTELQSRLADRFGTPVSQLVELKTRHPQRRKSGDRERLHHLAREHGVPLIQPQDDFPQLRVEEKPRLSTPQDEILARELVLRRRDQYPNEVRSNLFKAKSQFDHKELALTLKAEIRNNSSPGIINALINLGANVNLLKKASTSILKKVTSRDQKDQRSDVLLVASQSACLQTMRVLTAYADEISLGEALPIVMRRGDTSIAKVLLERGANPKPFHEEFKKLVRDSNEELVELFMRAPHKPCMNCLNESLVLAARQGSFPMCSSLLFAQAQASFNNAAAFMHAIQSNDSKLALAIALAPSPPSQEQFNDAFKVIYSLQTLNTDRKRLFLEICVLAGTSDATAAEMLLTACGAGQLDMVKLLIFAGASVEYQNGAALRRAIIACDLELMSALLISKPSVKILQTVIDSTMANLLGDINMAFHLMQHLINAGATGPTISVVLIEVLHRATSKALGPVLESADASFYTLIELLVERGHADLDHNSGLAFGLAAGAPFIDVLQLFLERNPSQKSLDAAFETANSLPSSHEKKKCLLQMIIEAGARGDKIDDGLILAVNGGSDAMDVVKRLLTSASVDYKGGHALLTAMKNSRVDVFALLLTRGPSLKTLEIVWRAATTLVNSSFQREVFEKLLQHNPSAELADGAFIDTFTRAAGGTPDLLETCQLLANRPVEQDVLDLALETAIKTSEAWCSSQSLPAMQFLLARGVTGVFAEYGLTEAAGLYSIDAVNLFARAVEQSSVFSDAFGQALLRSEKWLEDPDVFEVLIEHGANGESLDIALIEVVEAYCTHRTTSQTLGLLLQYGANINFANGQAVMAASHHGDASLLSYLFQFDPTQETVNLSFTSALLAGHDEKTMLAIIDIFLSIATPKPEINYAVPGEDPPLFIALMMYPGSTLIVKRLIDFGANLEATVVSGLYETQSSDMVTEPEAVTVLPWTIVQVEDPVSDEVIYALVDAGADVDALTEKTQTSALILAANYRRGNVIAKLLAAKAYPGWKNSFGHSALLYASVNGDLNSVNIILKSKPPKDDGSVHEATRQLYGGVVEALLKVGHDPDFTSTRHGGRTPLGELCLFGNATENPNGLERVLNALVKQKVDPLKKWRKKTMLFLVLDNVIDAVPMLEKLLERLFNKIINHKANLAEEDGYIYSATMYIKKGLLQAPEGHGEKLLELLEDHGAEDRYYAVKADYEQPSDAVNMPSSLVKIHEEKMIRLRKIREREEDFDADMDRLRIKHKIKMGNTEEEEFQKMALMQQRQDIKLEHYDQLVEHKLKGMNEVASMKSDLKWKHDTEARIERQRVAEEKSAARREEHQAKMRDMDQEQRQKLAFHRTVDREKLLTQSQQSKLKISTAKQLHKVDLTYKTRSASIQKETHQQRMQEIKAKYKVAHETRMTAKNKSGGDLKSKLVKVGTKVLVHGAVAMMTGGLSIPVSAVSMGIDAFS